MTHKLTIKDKDYLLVEVSLDTCDFKLNYEEETGYLLIYKDNECGNNIGDVAHKEIKGLDYINLKIINTISNLTEEECKELTTLYPSGLYGTEEYKETGMVMLDKTAKESFITLLKSKNILAKSFIEIPLEPQIFKEMRLNKFEQELKEYQNLPDELLLIEINN